jgi:hypothetical protein
MLTHDRKIEPDMEDCTTASWNLPSLPVSYAWVQHELLKSYSEVLVHKNGVYKEVSLHETVNIKTARIDKLKITMMYTSIPERIKESIQNGVIPNLTELKCYSQNPHQWVELYNYYTLFQASYHPTDDLRLFNPLLHFYTVKSDKLLDAAFVTRLLDKGEVEETRKGSSIFCLWRSKDRLSYIRQLKNMDFDGFKKLLTFIV